MSNKQNTHRTPLITHTYERDTRERHERETRERERHERERHERETRERHERETRERHEKETRERDTRETQERDTRETERHRERDRETERDTERHERENKWYPQHITLKNPIFPTLAVLWENLILHFSKLRKPTPSFCTRRTWGVPTMLQS